MKKILGAVISFALLSVPVASMAQLSQTLSGRILLQVEAHGEAWYVNPLDAQRYFMGRPEDAFQLMREFGLGITTADLETIPKSDQNSTGNLSLRKRLSGRILLQVEEHGEAWYINPVDTKRYFLGRPTDAFNLMRQLGLGITNKDLQEIPTAPNSLAPNGNGPSEQQNLTQDQYHLVRTQLLSALNNARKNQGVGPLSMNALLTTAAQNHANDMTAQKYFALESPQGKDIGDWVEQAGYEAHFLAANIANTAATPETLVSSWQNNGVDTTKNLLNDEFEEIGIGIGIVNGVRTYTVIFSESLESYFNQVTAGLADIDAVTQQMLNLVNAERSKRGVSPLVLNALLQKSTQNHTDDMLERSYYSHETPEGKTVLDRVRVVGYTPQAVGENIAKGQLSVEEVMQGWIDSKEHLDNIIDPDFTEIGFGVSFGKNNNGFEVIWGQNFGKPF